MDNSAIKKDEKKHLTFRRTNSRDKELQSVKDNESDSNDRSALPRRVRSRLHDLFHQIEDEFSEIYAENLELHKTVSVLNEKLVLMEGNHPPDKSDTNGSDSIKVSGNAKGKSSQISQRLKTTYKTGTSKLVSSFKPTANVVCRPLQEFHGHKDGIWDVDSLNTNNNIAGTASADQKAKLWNINTGSCIGTYHGHSGSVNCIRFHQDKQIALTVSGDMGAHIWSFECPRMTSSDEDALDREESIEENGNQDSIDYRNPLMRIDCHSSPVVCCDWLVEGHQFVTASWDRTSNLVDSLTGQVVQTLGGHDLPLTHVSAHAKHKMVVTSSRDSTFRVSDFRAPPIHTVIVGQGHTQSVSSAVFTNDDKVVSSGDDRYIKIWDLKSMRTPLASIRFDSSINRISVSRRGVIVIPHDNRQIRLYDTSGNRLARLPRNDRISHRRVVTATAWVEGCTPSVLSCGWDKLMINWRVELPHSFLSQK